MKNGSCCCLVSKLCLTLCIPMDWSTPGSSVHGIFQARILVWVAIFFSRGSFGPKDQTSVSWIAGGFYTTETPGKLSFFPCLIISIQETKIMESGPITLWQIDGETVETVRDFILGGSKSAADGDCSHEIKRHLLHGRKAKANLDSLLKSRDITVPTKVHIVKVTVFQ